MHVYIQVRVTKDDYIRAKVKPRTVLSEPECMITLSITIKSPTVPV